MSPAVYNEKGFRFYFFSREEQRMHIHVVGKDGEAKFWIEPEVTLATSYNLSVVNLSKLEQSVREHEDEIRSAWHKHFGG
ncbi:hypothetical protein ETAE_3079 [Edwardsiella piscicida]|uniref:DUF4160 domain-containing protein n=2 Tax=Edwardsiella piscicida TaxID=1263550 RepID=A0AAQ3C2A6_EDWPI|nr:DUF4160 domain-containing protein [Edwardsiella piscicida]ACY85912.1 hypothetical protein ETAE_3079 [Edwardsiella tarda EIB202]MDM3866542.1 DUF4160 domain-containing protein [Edwardsiella piscicida]QHR95296.1 DUF4160 domain-containing protein [Edwardsiella piscicida]UJT82120.1 DUF4160 domain-containing protein [Edwardsiella piscicida]UJT85388.1 DUF4160 domain-containing protein [Edwardsiella piscicida]